MLQAAVLGLILPLLALASGASGASPQRPAAPAPAPAAPPGTAVPARKPAARCTLPTGESVPAEQVLADLRAGKDVLLNGQIVQGSLDADMVFPSADERKASTRVV